MHAQFVRSFRVIAAMAAFATVASALMALTPFQPPVSYDEADKRAGDILGKMSEAQKLELISGHNAFFIHGFPELGIPELRMSDATQGVRKNRNDTEPPKTVAFPAPINLAATWNPEVAYQYAHSVGEECRGGGIAILLGPGMNIYRNSQCGRNFEYFGEDPYLAGTMIASYVRGVLDTGTIPTLKHFVANNTDHFRRTSNSIVDERALHEIYTRAFKAGIDAGAMAVMTSYNQLNGEWCGQSHYVITDLLRQSLGFKWLVMTDWTSVWDAEKVIKSGQDLEMPGNGQITKHGAELLQAGKVSMADIDTMCRSILRTEIAMGLLDRPVKDEKLLANLPAHEQAALQTAREGIVLLKNDGVLPLRKDGTDKILVTGLYVDQLAHGGGSAYVPGYDVVTLHQALADTYGDRVEFVESPTDEQLRSAKVVLLSTGTFDSEGSDRAFELPAQEERRVERVITLNPHTVVIVNSGGGVRMTDWNDRAAAVVYAWYPGQIGNRALAEVLCGETNPSGKLPITIERTFADSPAYGYMPAGDVIAMGGKWDKEMSHPVYPIEYKEGVFVGYRWYDEQHIAPLYAFGSGLSYTTFAFADLRVSAPTVARDGTVTVTCTVKNTGKVAGEEVVQLYVHPAKAPVARPEKELKGFAKVKLAPGESHEVALTLSASDFAYWDVASHDWAVPAGKYQISIGGASDNLPLTTTVTVQ